MAKKTKRAAKKAKRKAASSDFIVRFEGVDLPTATKARIAEAIQATAYAEFAQLDLAPDFVGQIPRIQTWAGIHLRRKKPAIDSGLELPNLVVVEKPGR